MARVGEGGDSDKRLFMVGSLDTRPGGWERDRWFVLVQEDRNAEWLACYLLLGVSLTQCLFYNSLNSLMSKPACLISFLRIPTPSSLC